jgi:hypothetical protein
MAGIILAWASPDIDLPGCAFWRILEITIIEARRQVSNGKVPNLESTANYSPE